MGQPWKVPCFSSVAGAADAMHVVVVAAVVVTAGAAAVACAAVEDILGAYVGHPVVLMVSDAELGMDTPHMGDCLTLAS